MTTGFQELGRKILNVVNASHATTPEVDTSSIQPLFNSNSDVIVGTKPPTHTSQVCHNVPSYVVSSNVYRETEPSYSEQPHPEQPMTSTFSQSSQLPMDIFPHDSHLKVNSHILNSQ